MPFCGSCGAQIINGKFCGQCGAKNEYGGNSSQTAVEAKPIEIKQAPAPGSMVQVLIVDSTGKTVFEKGDFPLTNGTVRSINGL